jgi:hypothetical protein
LKTYFVRGIKHLFYIIFCDFNFCGPELTAEYRRNYRLYDICKSYQFYYKNKIFTWCQLNFVLIDFTLIWSLPKIINHRREIFSYCYKLFIWDAHIVYINNFLWTCTIHYAFFILWHLLTFKLEKEWAVWTCIIIICSQYNRFFIYSNDNLLQVSSWYVLFKGNSLTFITCLSCK